ncbi:hypothetical protein Y032_0008g173 [Ancylostoma ceylanicum]|uniref:Trypsin Inhibitor like cysteine rich domain protein n=1 Tax=Ancylostoma ceylanicum TaxID=53326 RepID=A0A016VJH3_9BILA|nr:hypothetical protein Y032_0008g173 [Ancylostoma ceylanicum]
MDRAVIRTLSCDFCGHSVQLLRAQPRPCPAICGPPACVCKPNTYRYNDECVSAAVCEGNGGDGSGDGNGDTDAPGNNTTPPVTTSPTPCGESPCPDGSVCSGGQAICSYNGECTTTPSQCIPGDNEPSTTTPSEPVVIPCKRFPCPDGYICTEGATICNIDGCVTRPTQCVPEMECPRNMERVKCYPMCEQDCQGGERCEGKQCNSLGRCVCKKGYILVTSGNRKLGCIKKKDCACEYDFD